MDHTPKLDTIRLDLYPKPSDVFARQRCAVHLAYMLMGERREALSKVPAKRPNGSPYIEQNTEEGEFLLLCDEVGFDGRRCEGQCPLTVIGDKLFLAPGRPNAVSGICKPQKPAEEDTSKEP